MKKIYFVALAAVVAFGAAFTSCDGGVSTKPTLKNEADSISYSYGVFIYEKGGLKGHLQQMGLFSDTSYIAASYRGQIAAAEDDAKKAELEKEMKTKIDSLSKVNDRNMAELLKGLQEGIKSGKEKEAYMAGIMLGQQIGTQMMPMVAEQVLGKEGDEAKDAIDKNIFLSGLAAIMKNSGYVMEDPASIFDMKMEEARIREQMKQEAEMKAQYTDKIEAEAKFMEENKAKDGVVTLPSGVQYKILKEGNGPKPTASDMVKVDYHGTLVDGTVFDSSVERKQPATFNVSAVIKGWTEVLQLMPVGSKWIVYIPYDQAYGAQDRGTIKPFSTLIFEITLIGIETPANTPAN